MKRFSIVENGYDVEEVNKFIDIVIKRLEQLDNEAKSYQEEVIKLRNKLEDTKHQDEKVTKTLFAIQQTADRLKNMAKEEADMIIEEAKRNANAIVHEALLDAASKEKQALEIKKSITIYNARVKSLLEAQLQITEDLEKVEL